jgi:pre-mRNA-processing factor 19
MDTAEDGSSAAATAVTGVTAQKLTQIIDTTMTRLNSVRSSTVKALQKAAYTVDELGKQALVSSHPLHAVRNAGITCVAVSPTDDTLVATGGNDKQVIVFARTKKKKVATLKGHTGAITSVDFGKTENTYRLLASAGGNEAKVWKAMTGTFKNNMTPIYTTACHDGEVRACFHPSDELLFTASHDQSWAVHDLATQTVMGKVLSSTTTDAPYVDLAVHPDGFLLGVATSNKIPIFDVKSNGVAALLEGHTGNVTKIAFSENGYHLASGDSDGVVKVWDLRKRLCLKTFEHKGISEVTALAFDPSATYLSFGGITGVAATYKVKKRDAVVAEWQHSGAATGIAYGTGSRSFLASVSLDRKLNFYSVV